MIPSDYTRNSILTWTNIEQFEKRPLADGELYDMVGFLWTKPKVGQTVCAEFERSWIQFEFVEVNPCRDPHDMFFAKVKPIKQELK
jgi:hypothetical protein